MKSKPPILLVGHEPPPLRTPDEIAEREARRAAPDNTKTAGRKKVKDSGSRRNAVRRRFALLYAVADLALPRMSRNELRAWMILYRHAKPDGTVTASVADLARRSGCCERSMRSALSLLQKHGLAERIKRGTLAGGPSVWRLIAPPGDAS